MLRRAFRGTNQFFSHIIGGLFVILLSLAGAAIALRFDYFALNLFRTIKNETVVFGSYAIIILAISYPFIFLIHFFTTVIFRQASRQSVKQIHIKSFAGFKGKDTNYAWLLIENQSEVDLRDCYLDLKSLERHEVDGFLHCKDYVIKSSSKFSWPDYQTGDEKIVRRKNSTRINVAKLSVDKNALRKAEDEYVSQARQDGIDLDPEVILHGIRPVIEGDFFNRFLELTMEDGDHSAFPVRRNYYFELGFNCQMDGKNIDEIIFTGFIFHDCIGDLVRFFFEPGKMEDYEEILHRLDLIESELSSEELEYFKKSQPFRNWGEKSIELVYSEKVLCASRSRCVERGGQMCSAPQLLDKS